jgi:RHS repeat-associated protein
MRKGTVATSYRYGFNGKEQDKNGEFGGLNHYDYGFRIYNPGIGRFLSVDPLYNHPNQIDKSPYAYAWDDPVNLADPDGRCPICPLLKGAAGATIDYFLQGTINFASGMSLEDAFSPSNIDKFDVIVSGLQGALPWTVPGGNYAKPALAAVSDVFLNYSKAIIQGTEYSTLDATGDFIIGFTSQIGADRLGKLCKQRLSEQKLLGGQYKDLKIITGKEERHHMPADKVSPNSTTKGDAIIMDIDDHYQTESWGRSKKAQKYRQQQKELIDKGKYDEAQQMDIDDVKGKFGKKYDKAIKQMQDAKKKRENK